MVVTLVFGLHTFLCNFLIDQTKKKERNKIRFRLRVMELFWAKKTTTYMFNKQMKRQMIDVGKC